MFNDNAAPSDWTIWNIIAVILIFLALTVLLYGIITGICGG